MIGSFGIAKCGDLRKIVMGFTTFLAILVTLLIICGMAAWSEDPANLKQIGWAKTEATILGTTVTNYYGLQGWSNDNTNTFAKYSGCTTDLCDKCNKAGQAALGLMLTSFFMMIVVTLTSFIRIFNDSELIKIISVIFTFLIWIFLVAAFGNWNQQCYNDFPSGNNAKYWSGYGAIVSAWVLSTFLFFDHLLVPVTEGGSSSGGSGGEANVDTSKA